jgi:hypothetical protein
MVTDEADAVLHILSKKERTEADWQRLFSSEGYVRLKKRDTEMGRPFEDADFRTFVLSDDLAKRAPELTRTLGLWTGVDPSAAAHRALAYLPEGARIRAKVYPVIKPKDNSFVFEVKIDPAIFLYLDPAVPPAKLENTLAHELHHIGFGGSCPTPAVEAEIAKLPAATRTALLWMGAFGEGIAMLAAAGGPDVHPHTVSPAADRERWDRDVARFPEDLSKLEAFFRDVLAGKLSEEEAQKAAMSFYGEQGPWYTVGWKMAASIEKALGRERLVAAVCDPRRLLPAYNEAARKLGGEMPVWSEQVMLPFLDTPRSSGRIRPPKGT